MKSKLVVISWWSNCLALACLHRLAELPGNRQLYVVQVGKSLQQRAFFRTYLPARVTELHYPPDSPGEHCRVLEWVSRQALRSEQGLWFIDHDLMIPPPDLSQNESDSDEMEKWLRAADRLLGRSKWCLFLPDLTANPAVTQPAFWVSPARWPEFAPGFDPIPFQARPESLRPDLYRHDGNLRMPVKDTLIQVREALSSHGMVGFFSVSRETVTPDGASGNSICPSDDQASGLRAAKPAPGRPPLTSKYKPPPLAPFPQHTHLGGLSLFCGPILPPQFSAWMERTLKRFLVFFKGCPPEWIAIEDPVLLERLAEFSSALNV